MPASRLTQLERALADSMRNQCTEIDGPETCSGPPKSLSNADLLNSVLANAPLVLWEIDADGIFILSTGRGLEVIGLKPGESLGKSVYDLYQDYPAILDDIRRALAGDEHRSVVEISGIYFDSWYAPLLDAGGQITGVRGVATVITEQKHAEKELQHSQEALRESQDRFAKAFHSSPLGIMFTRLEDGKVIEVNDAFERISGYARHELIGQTAAELNSWIDPAEREQFVKSLREQGRVRDAEYKFRSKTGQQRIGRVSAEMIDLHGSPCVLTLCEDITQQLEAEAASRESQRRLETLARIAPVGIFHTDSTGNCVYINEHLCSLAGISPSTASGSGWSRAVHPDDRERVIAAWQAAVQQRIPFRCEYRVQRPDEVVAWVLTEAMPEFNDAGDVTSFVGIVIGIDGFKQLEEAQLALNNELTSRISKQSRKLSQTDMTLQEQIAERQRIFADLLQSQARWKSVVEDAPDYILIVDRDHIVRYINHTIPPLSKSDVEGQDLLVFIPTDYQEQVRAELQSVFETGVPVSSEMTSMGPDNTKAWYSSRIGAVKVDGEVVAVSIVARDITQQRQIEEDMRRRKADWAHISRLNTMGELAATLAHQLNQPLSAISNYAGGCAVRLQAGSVEPAELITVTQKIGRQANNASQMIVRMLDFVRKQDLVEEEVCLNQLIPDAVALASAEAKQHGVQVEVNVDPQLPGIIGDRIQIEQVLLNLIINAIDALKDEPVDDKQVTVTTSSGDDRHVRFSVSDNGCGLPDDFNEWGFEPFESSKSNGIGMGLSISRSIVESHRGQVWATANENGGATFFVSLPINTGDRDDE